MRKLTNKKGDINLSFGVIFSIILIAVFIFSAIYAINFFLNYSECSQIGKSYESLQEQVSNTFVSQSTLNKKVKLSLPGSIEMICFANLSQAQRGSYAQEYDLISVYSYEEANTFLLPGENSCNMPFKQIKRINLPEIIKTHNPYCIYVEEELTLNKKIYDASVLIE